MTSDNIKQHTVVASDKEAQPQPYSASKLLLMSGAMMVNLGAGLIIIFYIITQMIGANATADIVLWLSVSYALAFINITFGGIFLILGGVFVTLEWMFLRPAPTSPAPSS